MNDQLQMMNQHHMIGQQALPPVPPQMVGNPSQMMGQSYGQWSQPQAPPHSMTQPPIMNFSNPMNPMYAPGIPKPGRGANNWKGKKPMDKHRDMRRKDNLKTNMNNMSMNMNMNMNMNMINNNGVTGLTGGSAAGGGGVYQPPTLYELEQQNRLKAKRFYHPKRKFNRMGPYAHAPRNTTSYIIRAKKSGGIASLVSPCPVTPAVLPTPVFSPSREALVDMAKEEWGVDGYGSMKGLIRLRSPGHDEATDDYDEDEDGGSSESDVEEHVEVERRLNHDLSRFEMIYPNTGVDYHNVLENRVDDQDTHIAQLEEENLILKERLYLMEREFGELRRRLLSLERQNHVVEDINEEVVENMSENDSEDLRNAPLLVNQENEEVDFIPRDRGVETGVRRENSDETLHNELKELAVGEKSFDNELRFGVTTVNEFVEHNQELAGESCEKPNEQSESVLNMDLGSADGTEVDPTDKAGNENDSIVNVVNNGGGVILKKEDETMVSETLAGESSFPINNEEIGNVVLADKVGEDRFNA